MGTIAFVETPSSHEGVSEVSEQACEQSTAEGVSGVSGVRANERSERRSGPLKTRLPVTKNALFVVAKPY